MHPDLYTKSVLTAIALLLGILVVERAAIPTVVSAQSNPPHLYIEPRTTTIRKPDGTEQVEGKVVINTQTGDIWGFPTLSGMPYPVDPAHSEPPVSNPIYLGRFDFSKIK